MIINSTTLRNDYNRVAQQCHESGEAVYVTKNGEGDTVIMSVLAFETMMQRMRLSASILDAERNWLTTGKSHSVEDVSSEMQKVLDAKR